MYQDDSCMPGRLENNHPGIVAEIWKATGGLCPVKKEKIDYQVSTILEGVF